MTERPILFSAPMVRALLDGRKTQTRRVLKEQPTGGIGPWPIARVPGGARDFEWRSKFGRHLGYVRLPCSSGDRLWVREDHYQFGHWEPVPGVRTKGRRQKWRFVAERPDVLFDAPDGHRKGRHHRDPWTSAWHKRLGRFMPRKFSRLTLIVESVKVERLQDISEEDAIAEGVTDTGRRDGAPYQHFKVIGLPEAGMEHDPIPVFSNLWEFINGPGAWKANPWVAAYTFYVQQHEEQGR